MLKPIGLTEGHYECRLLDDAGGQTGALLRIAPGVVFDDETGAYRAAAP